MGKKLIIVFGHPGAGKSYVANILKKQFGYYSYNGDDALPDDMKKKILEKSDVTMHMRQQFVANIIKKIHHIEKKYDALVVHQALIKEHMRQQLKAAYPNGIFIWVKCNDKILKKRYMKREYFNLGLEYLQVMIDAFEPPDEPYISITNDSDGPEKIVQQLSLISP